MSKLFLSHNLRGKDGYPMVNPMSLKVLVASDARTGKTALSPGPEAWAKGR